MSKKTMPQLRAEAELMASWLRRQVFGNGFDGVVIDMSGGFDSSFCAFIASCSEALGPDGVVGILMPCRSSGESIEYGLKTCKELNIRHFIVDLEPAYIAMTSLLNTVRTQQGLPLLGPLEGGNIKARMRMNVLYSFNWVMNLLVLNTCNLSETLTGNETKWGDAVGDLGLLNNYTKTELRHMAVVLGFDFRFPEIFDAVPTPDLEEDNPGHTDENIMGLSYDVLDACIRGHDSIGSSLVPVTPRSMKKFQEMRFRSQHKRDPMPCFDPEMEIDRISAKTVDNL